MRFAGYKVATTPADEKLCYNILVVDLNLIDLKYLLHLERVCQTPADEVCR